MVRLNFPKRNGQTAILGGQFFSHLDYQPQASVPVNAAVVS